MSTRPHPNAMVNAKPAASSVCELCWAVSAFGQVWDGVGEVQSAKGADAQSTTVVAYVCCSCVILRMNAYTCTPV